MPASSGDVKGPAIGLMDTSLPDTPLEMPAVKINSPESADDGNSQSVASPSAAFDSDESQEGSFDSKSQHQNDGQRLGTPDTSPIGSSYAINFPKLKETASPVVAPESGEGQDGQLQPAEKQCKGPGKITDKKFIRKSNKPKMEKKRRERMNNSLMEMKAIVCEASGKNPAQYPKQEKTSILEMAVEFLKTTLTNPAVKPAPPGEKENFRRGFEECKFLTEIFLSRELKSPCIIPDIMQYLTNYQIATGLIKEDEVSYGHRLNQTPCQRQQHQHQQAYAHSALPYPGALDPYRHQSLPYSQRHSPCLVPDRCRTSLPLPSQLQPQPTTQPDTKLLPPFGHLGLFMPSSSRVPRVSDPTLQAYLHAATAPTAFQAPPLGKHHNENFLYGQAHTATHTPFSTYSQAASARTAGPHATDLPFSFTGMQFGLGQSSRLGDVDTTPPSLSGRSSSLETASSKGSTPEHLPDEVNNAGKRSRETDHDDSEEAHVVNGGEVGMADNGFHYGNVRGNVDRQDQQGRGGVRQRNDRGQTWRPWSY